MSEPDALTREHRWFFVAVAVFALWVGIWGYLVPTEIDRAIPWLVPPLHARFLGAMYLSGATLLFGASRMRLRRQVPIVLVMTFVWTGMLGLVSFLRLDEFTLRKQVPFWFFAYVVYPIVGAWLWWRDRPVVAAGRRDRGSRLPTPARVWLTVQGVACAALAAALFVAPTAMSERWPWAIPPLLAHIYAGPFLSYGVGSLLVAAAPDRSAIRLPLLAMVVFAGLVLLASMLHRRLFDAGSLGAVLWFGGFASAVAVMGATVVADWRAGGSHRSAVA